LKVAQGLSRTSSKASRTNRRRGEGAASAAVNVVSMTVSRLAVAAMGWAGTLLIVRHLSLEDWGRFSFVFALLGILSVFTGATNPRVVFRALEEDDGELVGTYVLLRFAIGVLTYAIALAFVSLGNYPPVVLRATAIAGLSLVLANTSYGYDVLYQFRMRLSQIAIAGALGQAVQLGLITFLALFHTSMVVFTIPAVACEVVTFAWKLSRLPRDPPLRYRIQWHRWVELVKLSVPLAIGGALGTLYYNLDTIMLSKMDTFHAVGLYSIAYKFSGVLLIIPQAAGAVIFPLLVRHWPDDPHRFRLVLARTARFYLVVGALVTVEFVVFASKAITLLYGHAYAPAAGAARVVVASECLGFFTSLAVTALVSINRNVFYPVATLLGLLLNLGLNLWLIPLWSYDGSAWATIITEVVVVMSLWIPLERTVRSGLIPLGSLARVGLCAACAAGAAVGMWRLVPWPVAATVAFGVYVLGLALLGLGSGDGLRSIASFDEAPPATT
jgi:O-antigen/teichoic acid export membrane protein